jgi:hypothetical protein
MMKYPITHSMAAALVLLLAMSAMTTVGADYYVDANRGRDVSYYGNGPEWPWKTIAYAIENAYPSALDPAIIHIAPGTYSATANGDSLPLRARSNVVLLGQNARSTVIDREDAGLVIECVDAAGVVIEGLTVTGGLNGTICCENAAVLVRSCVVSGNRSAFGSGLACPSGLYSWGSVVQLEQTSFTDNQGSEVICLVRSDATIRDSRILNNGANAFWASECSLVISGCAFERNSGGLYCEVSDAWIDNCVIRSNVEAAGQDGAGLSCCVSTMHVTRCVIANNNARSGAIQYLTGDDIVSKNCGENPCRRPLASTASK